MTTLREKYSQTGQDFNINKNANFVADNKRFQINYGVPYREFQEYINKLYNHHMKIMYLDEDDFNRPSSTFNPSPIARANTNLYPG